MSQVKFYKGDNQVYPEIQTASESNDVSFMSPITIDAEGNAYCGITVVEVQEDGFFIVDKNMNAAFSSSLGGSNTTIINNGVDSNILDRVNALETTVSKLNSLLSGINSISIV